jgi:hypothetical protein
MGRKALGNIGKRGIIVKTSYKIVGLALCLFSIATVRALNRPKWVEGFRAKVQGVLVGGTRPRLMKE